MFYVMSIFLMLWRTIKQRGGLVRPRVVLNRVVKKGLINKVILVQRPEGGERLDPVREEPSGREMAGMTRRPGLPPFCPITFTN